MPHHHQASDKTRSGGMLANSHLFEGCLALNILASFVQPSVKLLSSGIMLHTGEPMLWQASNEMLLFFFFSGRGREGVRASQRRN